MHLGCAKLSFQAGPGGVRLLQLGLGRSQSLLHTTNSFNSRPNSSLCGACAPTLCPDATCCMLAWLRPARAARLRCENSPEGKALRDNSWYPWVCLPAVRPPCSVRRASPLLRLPPSCAAAGPAALRRPPAWRVRCPAQRRAVPGPRQHAACSLPAHAPALPVRRHVTVASTGNALAWTRTCTELLHAGTAEVARQLSVGAEVDHGMHTHCIGVDCVACTAGLLQVGVL